jgi:phage recombination protein Bet
MTTELAVLEPKEVELVKRTVATGATDDELKLYFYDCQRRGVHPLDKLIHFTKRGGKYVPITSIDFMRQRATASGAYAGKDPSIFKGEPGKAGFEATLTVYRLVQGVRCAWTSTARWSEYFPGEQQGHMWKKMPHVMLEKCAEALALRQAFPNELQGLYTKEEMEQAADEKPKPTQGSLRERVIKQVEISGEVPSKSVQRRLAVQLAQPGEDVTQFVPVEPVEEAGPLPVVALPPPTEPEALQQFQRGILKSVTKAPNPTKKGNKPWGDITFELMNGTEVTATWFGFSNELPYEAVKVMIGEEIDFSVTPASNPKFKPTLEHFYPVLAEGPTQ